MRYITVRGAGCRAWGDMKRGPAHHPRQTQHPAPAAPSVVCRGHQPPPPPPPRPPPFPSPPPPRALGTAPHLLGAQDEGALVLVAPHSHLLGHADRQRLQLGRGRGLGGVEGLAIRLQQGAAGGKGGLLKGGVWRGHGEQHWQPSSKNDTARQHPQSRAAPTKRQARPTNPASDAPPAWPPLPSTARRPAPAHLWPRHRRRAPVPAPPALFASQEAAADPSRNRRCGRPRRSARRGRCILRGQLCCQHSGAGHPEALRAGGAHACARKRARGEIWRGWLWGLAVTAPAPPPHTHTTAHHQKQSCKRRVHTPCKHRLHPCTWAPDPRHPPVP
jgi:hypothetical protein